MRTGESGGLDRPDELCVGAVRPNGLPVGRLQRLQHARRSSDHQGIPEVTDCPPITHQMAVGGGSSPPHAARSSRRSGSSLDPPAGFERGSRRSRSIDESSAGGRLGADLASTCSRYASRRQRDFRISRWMYSTVSRSHPTIMCSSRSTISQRSGRPERSIALTWTKGRSTTVTRSGTPGRSPNGRGRGSRGVRTPSASECLLVGHAGRGRRIAIQVPGSRSSGKIR